MGDVAVTQADRDLAANLFEDANTGAMVKRALGIIRSGHGDDALAVQEIARHRIESQRPLIEALEKARDALHQHYVAWDGEPEDAVGLQLARSACDAAIQQAKGE